MHNSIRCLDARKVGMVSVITLILVFIAALLMPGCAFWKSPAREALAEHERQTEQTEAEKAAAEAERQRVAANRDEVVSKATQAASLLDVVSPDLAARVREQAVASVGKFNDLVESWDAQIQEANNRLAEQYSKRPALEEAVAQEDQRVDRGFGLAEALIGVGAVFGGGGIATAVQTVVSRTRKRVADARKSGKDEGLRVGAGLVMDSIQVGRTVSTDLDKVFAGLNDDQKKAMHAALEYIPDWRGLFASSEPTRVTP